MFAEKTECGVRGRKGLFGGGAIQEGSRSGQWCMRPEGEAGPKGQSSVATAAAHYSPLGMRRRTALVPPPPRWRRPSSEGAECCRRKPGRCWGGAAGEGPGTAGRGGRDAVPGKRGRAPVRKGNHELSSRAPASPYVRLPGLGSGGRFARFGTTFHSRVLGLRRRRPRLRTAGEEAPGRRPCFSSRGADVWQVSEAAGAAGVPLPGSAPPRRGPPHRRARPDSAAPRAPNPAPPRPAPLSGFPLALARRLLHPHPAGGGPGARRPSHLAGLRWDPLPDERSLPR